MAAAGVINRIVAVLDNDTAGRGRAKQLAALASPDVGEVERDHAGGACVPEGEREGGPWIVEAVELGKVVAFGVVNEAISVYKQQYQLIRGGVLATRERLASRL